MEGFEVPTPNNTFYMKQQEEAKAKKKAEITANVESCTISLTRIRAANPVFMMNNLQAAIVACGGENKPVFLEVTSDFIRVMTRVPLSTNLFPFIQSEEDNPRFHTVLTRMLVQCPVITGVRTIPVEEGAVVIVSFQREATK